jgi:hypothetical protein
MFFSGNEDGDMKEKRRKMTDGRQLKNKTEIYIYDWGYFISLKL